MTKSPNPVLILDSNIWVSERMLRSALGAATLHALIKSGGQIALPEIVELEVNRILVIQADQAVDGLKKSAQFLRQLTEHHLNIIVPSQGAVEKALDERWEQLSGVLIRQPFEMEHARAALDRIIDKAPPCGPNNEQFRDCCIWQCALDLAVDRPVHLVTSDLAFNKGRNRELGLASNLAAELAELNREVHLYPKLSEFLISIDSGMLSVDEDAIGASILKAVMPRAQEIATEDSGKFELGTVRNLNITGYATPKTSMIAISFSLSLNMLHTEIQGDEERQTKGRLEITGSCSYDPNTKAISDVELSGWSKSVEPKEGGFWRKSSPNYGGVDKMYSKGNFRII